MACPEWQDKLIDLTVDELPPEEARELELHVAQCADCASALSEFRGLHRVMEEHFVDREMPAHLVLVPERPRNHPWRLLSGSWGAAALGGALAVCFFVGLFLGGLFGPARRPFVREGTEKAALTRAEIEAMVAREVSARLAEQQAAAQIQNAKLAATLRQEQDRKVNQLGQKLEYLESAQKATWKETQVSNAMVELIARNSLERAKVQPVKTQE